MVQLICEGRCNPTIRDVDHAIANARQRHMVSGGALLDERLLEAIRGLVHTDHDEAGVDWYICHVCKTPRRCGGARLGVM